MDTRSKRFQRVIRINAVLIVAGLALFEAVMGKWFGLHSLRDLSIPVSQPSAIDTSRIYSGGKVIKYESDEYGFRGLHTSARDIDILAIGGSTTREIMVGDGETWTDTLGTDLTARLGRRVSVGNAGMEAHSTFGHIRAFDLWFSKIDGLKPKLVVAMVGINDEPLTTLAKGFDDFQPATPWHGVRNYIWNNSALYEIYRRLRGIYRAHITKVVHGVPSSVSEGDKYAKAPMHVFEGPISNGALEDPALSDRLAAYETRIQELIARIRAIGAVPVVVNQLRGEFVESKNGTVYKAIPGYAFDHMMTTYQLSKRYARHTMTACKRHGGVCIDLATELPIGLDERYDLVHTTPAGSRKIGLFLSRELWKLVGHHVHAKSDD